MKRPLVSILMPVFNGEAVVQLFASWQMRDAEQMPTAAQLSKNLPAAVRSKWVNGVSQTPGGLGVSEAMLRLEMTADVPTPAEYLAARRQLQLQLLTQRNAATPAQTWGVMWPVCWLALMPTKKLSECRRY